MSRTMIGIGFVLGALWAPVSTAQARERDPLGLAEDALDDVKAEGGACERGLYDDLRDVVRDLKDAGRDLSRSDERRLSRKVERLVEDAEKDCDRRVRKSLERVVDALGGGGDDDRGRDRDRDRDRADDAPKPGAEIPATNASKDCKDLFFMGWMIWVTGDTPDRELVNSWRDRACRESLGDTTQYWPNSTMAKSGSTWYYPSGTMAVSGGTYYYPNGTMVLSGSTWYYPNGTMAKSGSTWYYPDGNIAGGRGALESYSCTARGGGDCPNEVERVYLSHPDEYISHFMAIAMARR